MDPETKFERSAKLVKGMAERRGVDLTESALSARLDELVFACAGCTKQDECARLQNERRRLDQAPEYCVNKDLF